LSCIYLCLCLSSTVWCERGFSLMNNIKIKSRNRMKTDTLNDRMMILSHGLVVSTQNTKEINVIVDLAFENWSQARQRMPSRSHPGVLRPRAAGGVEVEVHDILSATDRAEEVNGQVRALTYMTWTFLLSRTWLIVWLSVSPFIVVTSWITMGNPASSDVLKSFQWKGKRLTAKKFEGGWSTASYKWACNRCEAPEDWQMFYYKDKDISGLNISLTSKNTVSPRNGWLLPLRDWAVEWFSQR